MKHPKGYNNVLRELRLALGWSQDKLAAATGLSRPTIQRHESNARPIDSDQLARYCGVFRCTPNDILKDAFDADGRVA